MDKARLLWIRVDPGVRALGIDGPQLFVQETGVGSTCRSGRLFHGRQHEEVKILILTPFYPLKWKSAQNIDPKGPGVC
jgi:hypothetical protein